jgi:hypothetical protein
MAENIEVNLRGKCSMCGAVTETELHLADQPLWTDIIRDRPSHFCDFCNETLAIEYARRHSNSRRGLRRDTDLMADDIYDRVAQHVCVVANILLRKLKEAK